MFKVLPHNNELKFGRHGFGYQNPIKVQINIPMNEKGARTVGKVVSVPRTDLPDPHEAEKACKDFLLELFPEWSNRDPLRHGCVGTVARKFKT
jgi:sarcosine oxidase/L-pipecolate oxidase